MMTVHVLVTDDRALGEAEPEVDTDRWRDLGQAVLEAEGVAGEMGLTFVDGDAMAVLNERHMGHDGPTDVLSFPLDGVADGAAGGDNHRETAVPALLGDVVVCPTVALTNAAEHGVTLEDELALLVVHGVLHVLGWDHAEDDERVTMQAREQEHLERWRTA
jgi:probable rRNA maturation factor